MKQGFKPKSISDIGLGMKVVVKIAAGVRGRGIVKCVNYMCAEPTPGGHFRWHIGVELDPGQGKYSSALISKMNVNPFVNLKLSKGLFPVPCSLTMLLFPCSQFFSFCSHVPKKLMAMFPCSLKPLGEPHRSTICSYVHFFQIK